MTSAHEDAIGRQHPPAAEGGFADPLAGWLWQARSSCLPAPAAAAWPPLTLARATAISQELYSRLEDGGARRSGWKFGAFSSAAQKAFGIDAPIVAPTLSCWTSTGRARQRVELASFISPQLEAEIGIFVNKGGELALVPCVEIADSRLPGWELPPRGAIADFGLQGAMVYGEPVLPAVEVSVSVRHDGPVVQGASALWRTAVESLDLLPAGASSTGDFHVATGSITPLMAAEPGNWTFDFGAAGTLELELSSTP
jgi:hypothetical protein